MADDLGLVVHSFDRPIADAEVKVVEDTLLMAAQHPGKITHGFEPGVRGPPEPLFDESFRPAFSFVVPKFTEALLEQVCAIAAKIELLQMSQTAALLIGEIFRIFQPKVSGALE